MGERSSIEWTDATWNPVTGCTKVSEGCRNCYAERIVQRLGQDFSTIVLHPERLEYPLHWKKPHRIFVNSMSDLFHENIADDFIYRVFEIMVQCPHHVFQVLTKRPVRMLDICRRTRFIGIDDQRHLEQRGMDDWLDVLSQMKPRPFPNVWLGVSVEDQQTADERIPLLLQTPAAVRFVSAEPLLGPIDLSKLRDSTFDALDGRDFECLTTDNTPPLNWVIVGGGVRARREAM